MTYLTQLTVTSSYAAVDHIRPPLGLGRPPQLCGKEQGEHGDEAEALRVRYGCTAQRVMQLPGDVASILAGSPRR